MPITGGDVTDVLKQQHIGRAPKVDEIDPESLKTQGQPHLPITRVLMS